MQIWTKQVDNDISSSKVYATGKSLISVYKNHMQLLTFYQLWNEIIILSYTLLVNIIRFTIM